MPVLRDQQELRVRRAPQGPQGLRVQLDLPEPRAQPGLPEPTARLAPLDHRDPPDLLELRAQPGLPELVQLVLPDHRDLPEYKVPRGRERPVRAMFTR